MKMKKFLLIQNPGVAPTEGYTLLGVSLTRDCGVSGTIGQFASGSKHAITTLLRHGLSPIIYGGKLRLEFTTQKQTVSDEHRSKDFAQVRCHMRGEKVDGGYTNTVKDLGWTVEFGQTDWTDINMALREFVSNAIDRTFREGEDFRKAIKNGHLMVDIVNENQVRAKDGFTRVFIEATPDVFRFYGELGIRFLHFSDHPEWVDCRILPKVRGLDESKRAMIYKQGVFVRQVENEGDVFGSLFDYNFGANFRLDECRNASDYEVKEAAARCLSVAEPDILTEVFRSLLEYQKSWESTFDSSYLSGRYAYGEDEDAKKRRKDNWHTAWDKAAGNAIMCRQGALATEQVAKKGHTVAAVQADSWVSAAERLESIPTPQKFLNDHEQKGRELLPATSFAQQAVDTVWGWIEACGRTLGKEKPPVGCFRASTDAESRTLGYYHPQEQKIYIEEACATDGVSKDLLRTALEECVHYATGSTDCSRDFQNYIIDLVVDIATQNESSP